MNTQPFSPIFTASIIISTFNRADYITQLLESLTNQSFSGGLDVIIVEAGSLASYHKILSIRSNFPLRISTVHLPNCSLGAARNHGVRLSKGHWCFFSDDDDVWHPDKILRVKEEFEMHDVISHKYVSSDSPCASSFYDNKSRGQPIVRSFSSIAMNFWGNRYGGGSSLSGRRSFLESVKFDEEMRSCEDIEWVFRALLSGARMGFINDPLVCYRIHKRRMTSSIWNNVKWDFILIKRYISISLYIFIGIFFKLARTLLRIALRR
jgi:glycosyltransferase involved in cell wall biosynthesis